ncbi:hypothetical protein WJ972_34570 [Achromobacter insuavis]
MIDNTKLPTSPSRLPAVWPFSLNQAEMPSSVSCSFAHRQERLREHRVDGAAQFTDGAHQLVRAFTGRLDGAVLLGIALHRQALPEFGIAQGLHDARVQPQALARRPGLRRIHALERVAQLQHQVGAVALGARAITRRDVQLFQQRGDLGIVAHVAVQRLGAATHRFDGNAEALRHRLQRPHVPARGAAQLGGEIALLELGNLVLGEVDDALRAAREHRQRVGQALLARVADRLLEVLQVVLVEFEWLINPDRLMSTVVLAIFSAMWRRYASALLSARTDSASFRSAMSARSRVPSLRDSYWQSPSRTGASNQSSPPGRLFSQPVSPRGCRSGW